MKHLLFFMLFIIVFLSSFGEKIILNTMDSPPYQIEKDNSGFLVEISKEALVRSGYEVEIRFVPWVRAMEEGKSGHVDGIIGAWYSKERENFFYYSKPIGQSTLSLLKLKERSFPDENIEELRKYKIGFVKSYYYPEILDKSMFKNYLLTNNTDVLIKFLLYKKVDLIPEVYEVVNYTLKTSYKNYIGLIEAVGDPLEVNQIYVVFSKKKKNAGKLLGDFNRELDRMIEDGTFDQIMNKY